MKILKRKWLRDAVGRRNKGSRGLWKEPGMGEAKIVDQVRKKRPGIGLLVSFGAVLLMHRNPLGSLSKCRFRVSEPLMLP